MSLRDTIVVFIYLSTYVLSLRDTIVFCFKKIQ